MMRMSVFGRPVEEVLLAGWLLIDSLGHEYAVSESAYEIAKRDAIKGQDEEIFHSLRGDEMLQPFTLQQFLDESNRIEGIGPADPKLVSAAEVFLSLNRVTVRDVTAFVSAAQPDAVIRSRHGLNVYVGNHVPPAGGPHIVERLADLLDVANDRDSLGVGGCYRCHARYETLHPFTDGNGRSGRILWLWMMGGIKRAPLGFLHHWYYQSLQNSRLSFRPTKKEA